MTFDAATKKNSLALQKSQAKKSYKIYNSKPETIFFKVSKVTVKTLHLPSLTIMFKHPDQSRSASASRCQIHPHKNITHVSAFSSCRDSAYHIAYVTFVFCRPCFLHKALKTKLHSAIYYC